MSDPELTSVDALAQLTFLVQGMLEHRAAEHGISLVQLRLLGLLRDRTPAMAELAKHLGLDKSSVTGLVDRAERRGLLERFRSPTDGRSVLVRLTDRGRALAAEGEGRFAADVDELLGRLPAPDRTSLVSVVSRLLVTRAEAAGIDLFPPDSPA